MASRPRRGMNGLASARAFARVVPRLFADVELLSGERPRGLSPADDGTVLLRFTGGDYRMKVDAITRAADLKRRETRGPVGAGLAELRAQVRAATIQARCELMRRQVEASGRPRTRAAA